MLMDFKGSHNIKKNKRLVNSLGFAVEGVKTVFRDERNFRFHCVLGLLAVIISFLFHLSRGEWLWVVFVIFLVLIMELMNTIMENVVDLVTNKEFHPIGKKIKDMGAALVLFSAFFAVVVAGIIFIPKVWELVTHLI